VETNPNSPTSHDMTWQCNFPWHIFDECTDSTLHFLNLLRVFKKIWRFLVGVLYTVFFFLLGISHIPDSWSPLQGKNQTILNHRSSSTAIFSCSYSLIEPFLPQCRTTWSCREKIFAGNFSSNQTAPKPASAHRNTQSWKSKKLSFNSYCVTCLH